jgi:hypothetical protein
VEPAEGWPALPLPQQVTLPTHPTHPMGAVAAEPLDAADPEELGDYQLIGRLGEGGMGTVYLGIGPISAGPTGAGAPFGAAAFIGPDRLEGELRLVAIKMIRADLARLPQFRERFLREADVARRVARFCTAEVLEVVDPPNGPPYLVTEFIDGLTLTRAVLAGGPLRTGDLERLAVSVAAALTAIHGAGLVHRDLKPSNVILSSLGPRVIDFGIARAIDAHGVLSHDIQRIGTPAFMAPEQANGQPVTAAADIFAWGGLVTYAGTGVLPFGDGPTPVQLYRVVHLEPNLEGLDPTLRPIVAQAMRKDPAERPTAQELFLRLVGMGPPTHPDPALSQAIRAGAIPAGPQPAQPAGTASGSPACAPTEPAAEAAAGGAERPDGQPVPTPTAALDDAPRVRLGAFLASGPGAGLLALLRPRRDPDEPPTAPPEALESASLAAEIGAAARAAVRAWAAARAGTGEPATEGGAPAGAMAAARRAWASRGAAGIDAGRRRGWRQRLRHGSLLVMPLLALLLMAVLIPVVLRRAPLPDPTAATVAADVAGAADQIRATQPELAAGLSLAAFRISQTPMTRAGLRTSFAGTAARTLGGQSGAVLAAAVSLDGRLAATASADGVTRLWGLRGKAGPVATLRGHDGYVNAVAFSPDDRMLAAAGNDRTVQLWDVSDPDRPVRAATLPAQEAAVTSVAFSPDRDLLATGGYDDTARLWDVSDPANPAELGVAAGHTGWVGQVAFSPDGRLLATASTDRTARIWDVGDPRHPRPLATLTGHTDYVSSVAFSPDGRLLATGGYDGTARLWDVTDPAHPHAQATLRADQLPVLALAFSPDGRTLATAGRDDSVHLWDLASPEQPRPAGRISGHTDWVQTVAFTPNGQALLTGSADLTARLTPLDDATVLATACRDRSAQLSQAQWQHFIPDIPYKAAC